MNITRRDALMGATAAAVVTGAATAPLTIEAALADDPVIPPALIIDLCAPNLAIRWT